MRESAELNKRVTLFTHEIINNTPIFKINIDMSKLDTKLLDYRLLEEAKNNSNKYLTSILHTISTDIYVLVTSKVEQKIYEKEIELINKIDNIGRFLSYLNIADHEAKSEKLIKEMDLILDSRYLDIYRLRDIAKELDLYDEQLDGSLNLPNKNGRGLL